MRHVLELGHRRVGVLSFGTSAHAAPGPADLAMQERATASVTKRRLEGCARALTAAGLPWENVPVQQCPVSSLEQGRAGARALLETNPDLTAVVAFSDPLALGAREAAADRGLFVPGDLSIVGFDDTAPPAERLTSVHQPHADKGRIAAERLLATLSGSPPAGALELLPTRLVVRDSTAAVRPPSP